MKTNRILLVGFCLFILGFGTTALIFFKQITLVVDGEARRINTFAFTVSQLLRETSVHLSPGDRLSPAPEHRLRFGETVTLEHAAQVYLQADGKDHFLISTERLPGSLLGIAGIDLFPGDQILADGRLVGAEIPLSRGTSHALKVLRSTDILLEEIQPAGIFTHTIKTTAPNLGQALWEAGIVVTSADKIVPPITTPLGEQPEQGSVKAALIRSRELTVQIGKQTYRVRSAAGTVGEALAETGLPLIGLDYSKPPESAPIPADGKIRITRVREDVIIEQTPVKFETEFESVGDQEIDTQRVIKAGEYGLLARRVRVRYENGKETARQLEGEWVARQPLNQVIGYGTKAVMHTLDTPDGTIRYWRKMQMWATSYSPSSQGGGDGTASGKKLKKGIAAVDRSLIPFGTRMYIPGYGVAEAADTGAISGRWIDLGYSNNNYVAWHQWVTVYFLWPPPANIIWIFP